jgi:tetratricopeptide (TPR) repeat protein
MRNSPEQVTAFEKQVEGSIDFQIDQLRKLDAKKSKALQTLQSNILDQIKQDREDDPSTPEKEEKYSADLLLTEDELTSVFEEVKKGNSQLFSENGIDSFWKFKSFIGLYGDEITFADSLQEITLFGKSVELVLPLGTNEQISNNFTAAIKKIEEHKDLETFITSATKFVPRGGMRIEFSIQRDGKEVKYSATPEHVLRVNKKSSTENIKEWTQTELSRRKLQRQAIDDLQQDKTLEDEQRYMIRRMIYKKSKVIEMRDEKEEQFKIPEKYQTIINQIKALRKQEKIFEDHCSVRILLNETSGVTIREKGDPRYTMDFKYEYLAQDGSVKTSINYYSNRKSIITEYFPQSDQDQKRTIFHKNGSIRRISEYQKDGNITTKSEYRENGTLESKEIGNNTDIYDESGTNVAYRRLRQEKTEQITSVMIGKNGENFATLDFMQQTTPEMSDSQYLDYLAQNLDTPQKLHLFFELFMQYVYDSNDPNNPLKKGTNTSNGEYWQLATETVERIEDGKMLGDCDDYAFLAKDILRKQGKISYVQGIPSHAICIWFEKKPNGNWDAYSMGTFGLDKNGNRYGMPVDQEKEKGYATLEEALNSLMPKYDGVGIGVGQAINYRIKNRKVEILHIPEKGKTATATEIPVYLLPNKKAVDRLVAAQWFTEVGQYSKAITEYKLLLEEDSTHSDIYHDELAITLEKSLKQSGDTERERILLEYAGKYPARPEYHDFLGELYQYKDDVKALKNFGLAIKKGSTIQTSYMEVADYYKQQRQFGEQIKTLELALVKVPSYSLNSSIYLELAEVYLEIGNKDKAIKTYESSLEKDDNIIESLAYLYYSHQQNSEKAKQLFFLNEPLEIENNPASYKHQVRLEKFYGTLLRKTFQENSSQFDTKYQTGKSYNPIKITPELLTQYPDIALLHSERTKALAKICKDRGEVHHFEQLANLYHQQGKGELALQTLQIAIKRFKNDKYEHKNLLLKTTEFLLVQGNIEKAIQVCKENKEILNKMYRIVSNSFDMGAHNEIIMKFYDQLLSHDTDSSIFLGYCHYLRKHNQSEKLKSVAEEGVRKFPDKKEDFQYYLKKEEEK